MSAVAARAGSDGDAEHLVSLADASISRRERSVAIQEPPWDGYCGLVKICDDESFKTLEQGFIGRPRPNPAPIGLSASQEQAGPPGAASAGSKPGWPSVLDATCLQPDGSQVQAKGGVQFSASQTSPLSVPTSLSDARRSVAASLTGAGSRVVSSLQAAAGEASRLMRSKDEEELTANGAGGVVSSHSRWITWPNSGGQQCTLADRLGRGLSEALQASNSEDASPEQQAAAAKRASLIANEAFKTAMAAMEGGKAQEAYQLAEVALRGVPSSKPRAMAKLHALRARAEAQLKAEGSGRVTHVVSKDPYMSSPVVNEAAVDYNNVAGEETSTRD